MQVFPAGVGVARNFARLVGNDPADGGENLLHRGLLTLCRLRHRSFPAPNAPVRAGHRIPPNPEIKSLRRNGKSMAWRRAEGNYKDATLRDSTFCGVMPRAGGAPSILRRCG